MICANGCLREITADESASLTVRNISAEVCIYEHRHLDCTRRAFLAGETLPASTAAITAE